MSSLASNLTSAAQSLDGLLLSKEELRQQGAADSAYLDPCTIFFELVLPPGITGWRGGTYLFPLQIAPQSLGMSEPYAVEVIPTQDGGLMVEEQGIVQRRIRIRGNTGFWPTELPINPPMYVNPPQGRSFGRVLPPVNDLALSGMRHFQWLQDSVFRLYGDLKRDPSTAAATQLIFHDPQAGDHWLVSPMSFASERSSSMPFVFPYEIELLVLDKAKANASSLVSPDASLLGSIKNVFRSTQNFLARASAAVQDMSAVQADLSRTVHTVGATIGQMNTLIQSVASFVAGTVEFVQAPYQAVSAIIMACESACVVAGNARLLGASLYAWPRPIEQRFRAMTTACEQLALGPSVFVRPATALQKQRSVVASAAAPAGAGFSSFASLQALGSSPLASDAVLQGSQTQAGAGAPSYPGTFVYRVQQGDSLSNLAARYLGSSTLWSSIAAANAMVPPIAPSQVAAVATTDDRPANSVLTVGQAIGIPSASAVDPQAPGVQVVGTRPDSSADEQAFGTDFALTVNANGQVDMTAGVTDGLPDIAAVTGVANVEQGLGTRLAIEQGTATMYPLLGLQGVIGSGQAGADAAALRLRVTQAILDDPRVESVGDLMVTPLADGTSVSASVRLKGTGQPLQLATRATAVAAARP